MSEQHFEPYLYLAGLTHDSALIAWGGFFFKVRDQKDWKLIDDDDLPDIDQERRECIGARSKPYGSARVEVIDSAGTVRAAETNDKNHVWITGLLPGTEYTYRVLVDGKEWAAGERLDWVVGPEGRGLRNNGGVYVNRFRTHAAPDESAALTFAVIGDFGTGVKKESTRSRRQREVAAALNRAVDERGVRLILTAGDNIYAGKRFLGLPIGDTGDEDDDWFFTFYQPYRYVINRVPVYPCVGNHDSGETEQSDDREQLFDNFFIDERFSGEHSQGPASQGPGLFYRFKYGRDIEFLCIDTSRQTKLFDHRFFERPHHLAFVQEALPEPASQPADSPLWRIPFSHHPAFCAGPVHSNSKSMGRVLVPLFERAGVRAAFSGHEHNFQHSRSRGVNYFITGGGGKVEQSDPSDFDGAHTVAWGKGGHFLVVEVDSEKMSVTPMAEATDGAPLRNLRVTAPNGDGSVEMPIIVDRG
ncbi:MAG TPA: metallophosphoesterase [Blastocatellia bacterium]|nr:metallophosphoesterase [Blastocatellia bacterium]